MADAALLSLNSALRARDYADVFAETGVLQVRDFLAPAAAERVAGILERGTAWNLAYSDDTGGGGLLTAEEIARGGREAMSRAVQSVSRQAAQGKFSFLYASYQILASYLEGRDQGHPLHTLLEFLNSPEVLGFLREATGDVEILKADAQATLYRPGHFLSVHNDSHPVESRRHAYTLGFTRNWEPHWGGELLFHDKNGDIERGLMPGFNVLTVFKVPRQHSVSFVPPFANGLRLSITGWLRDDPVPAKGADKGD